MPVLRMENDRIPKKVMAWKPVSRRLKGRPRLRWIDDVEDDLRHGCANHATEGKRFNPPSTAVT